MRENVVSENTYHIANLRGQPLRGSDIQAFYMFNVLLAVSIFTCHMKALRLNH